MNYDNWLKTVPSEITDDVLWKMKVYRLALFASDLSWHDVTMLMQDQRASRLAPHVVRHLLRIIPAERGPMLKEDAVRYLMRQNPDDCQPAHEEVPMLPQPLEVPRTT